MARRTMLAAALALAERWELFPAKFVGKQKLSYKSKKYNDGKNWGATKDPGEIKIDFKRWPRAGIGIPTGGENGIWVLEADTKEGHDVDGLAALRALEAKSRSRKLLIRMNHL
jgi:Bifunctional DNA primase/polymerase, N-terminal